MSRKRKSRFTAISAEQGNDLRGKAVEMMSGAPSSPQNASAAQQTLEQQRLAVAEKRNQEAAQEGMRQRDIRAQQRPFTPTGNKGMSDPSASGGGLRAGLMEKVASRRKSRDQPRHLFPYRK